VACRGTGISHGSGALDLSAGANIGGHGDGYDYGGGCQKEPGSTLFDLRITKKQSHNWQSRVKLSKDERGDRSKRSPKNKEDKAAESKPRPMLYTLSTLPWVPAAICAAIMLVNVLPLFAVYSAGGNYDSVNPWPFWPAAHC
jgi:hypothetical protein